MNDYNQDGYIRAKIWVTHCQHAPECTRLTLTCVLGRYVASTLQASLSGTFLQTARFGYATEGALFISAQLSTDAVSALRKVPALI